MSIVELSFSSGESSLSVRSFSVQESLSGLFTARLVARSPNDDIDLETIVGRPALLRIVSGVAWAHLDTRVWTGVVSDMELTRVEPSGLSTYELTLVPYLWLLSQRQNYRLFQHQSVVDIAGKLFDEWRVRHEWRVQQDRYPKLELRMQYGESDLSFLSRILEEQGITYYFEDDPVEGSRVVLHDEPQTQERRPTGPIAYFDDPGLAKAAEKDYLTEVRVGNRVRPGKLTIRDFDFRKPGFPLFAESGTASGVEAQLETYQYLPGAFLSEVRPGPEGRPLETPRADDKGVARHLQPVGVDLAKRRLEGARATKQIIHFKTNALDLSPGVVFSLLNHPRKDLGPDKELLVNSLSIEGEIGQEWSIRGTASFTAFPYRPALATKKPKIFGVQSAVVVGASGDKVHTDEFGRVRVQFHWDREGKLDDNSSVWIRVSQAWAGAGYGMINLPRVGNEVLVGFIEGDPDNPIIVGRVYNGAQQVPYKLPDASLFSAWKSDSNSNIILYIDIPGIEGFLEQAERDRLGVTKHDYIDIIGNNRNEAIRGDQGAVVGGNYAHGVIGEYSVIAGKELSLTSPKAVSLNGGFEISQTSGFKWQAGVTPVVPMIVSAMAVKVIQGRLDAAFPAGPPDLFAILQVQAAQMGIDLNGQLPPGVSWVPAIPVAVQDLLAKLFADFAGLFAGVLQPLLDALSQLSWAQLQDIFALIAAAPDLQTVIDLLSAVLPNNPNQPGLAAIVEDVKKLIDAFMSAIPNTDPAPGASASTMGDDGPEKTLKKIVMLLKVFSMAMDEMSPGTSIRIQPKDIRITTGKATIHLKDEDIEIKAKGSIKIEGASVSISPKPEC